jgi:hypothetical protein
MGVPFTIEDCAANGVDKAFGFRLSAIGENTFGPMAAQGSISTGFNAGEIVNLSEVKDLACWQARFFAELRFAQNDGKTGMLSFVPIDEMGRALDATRGSAARPDERAAV